MSKASQKINVPSCDICNGEYDTFKRIPIFLSCYHTFCLQCLQCEGINKAAVKCQTCHKSTSIDVENETLGLEINEKIIARLEKPNSAILKSSDEEVNKELYLWCLECKLTVQKDIECLQDHIYIGLETDRGKEMAGNRFRMLLSTYKNQLGGHLTKHRETDLALDAIQSSLDALRQQASFRKKENDLKIKELHRKLSSVTKLLGKLPEEMPQNAEVIHNSLQKYNDLVEKTSFTETTDFDRIRNCIVKMDIKSPDEPQLITPLCQSDLLINFPSVGATELEAHLLTTLSFLVLLSIQKEDRVTAIRPRKKSDSSKKPFQPKAIGKNWPDEKEEAVGKEFEAKKMTKTIKRSPSDIGTRPKSLVYNKADYSRPYLNQRSYPSEQETHVLSHWQQPSNEQVATKREPAQVAFQENYQVPTSVTIPPLMSLQNKKAFLALAVNGKPYGNFAIELRPDLAPVMCQKFLERCTVKDGSSYQGTIIYHSKAKTFIMGGKIAGQESLYMADASPLRKTRGAIFFRLKRDYVKTQCSIVSTDFCIHLGDESPDNHRTSTVFGYVSDGLAVCDAISYLDCCNRDHVAIASSGLVD